MKNKKRKFKNMVFAGLSAVLLIGCGKEVSVEGEVPSNAAAVSEVNEVQNMELKNTSAEEIKKAEELNSDSNRKSSFSSGEEIEQQDLIDTAIKDVKNYMGATIDLSQCEPYVTHFEKQEGIAASFSVGFNVPENMKILSDDMNVGPDGYPTKEAKQMLKTEYYVSYSEDKKLLSISILNSKGEESQIPLSIGECKKIAEEFLKTKKLVKDGKIEFMISKVVADQRVYFVYKNGTEGAIGIGINTYSSKVEDFNYMDKEQAEIMTDPSKQVNEVG